MKNMALTKSDQKDNSVSCCDSDEKYPYGLSLRLDAIGLTKLGIKELPKVGTTLTLDAKVTVTSVSERESTNGGASRDMSLQITAMELATPEEETSEEDIIGALYGGDKKA